MKLVVIFLIVFLLLGCNDESGGSTSEPRVYKNEIKASIYASNISDVITIDFEESRVGLYEYIWSVRFDANNDGVFGEGDIAFKVQERKESGEVERSVRLSDLNAWFVQYSQNGSTSRTGVVDIEVNNGVLSFVANRDLYEEFKTITTMTQVYVRVYRATPNVNSSDYLPDKNTYTQEQDTSIVIDPISDYTGTNSASDISKFTLEIFE